MKRVFLVIFFAAGAAGGAFAQQDSMGQHGMTAPAAGEKTAKGTGLIQQIDRDKGAVTIKHGPLPALNMGAMTMTYTVKDGRQLAKLQPLQKVEFDLTYNGRSYVITGIK
ncbi:MAG TPA: copper-binding protein [Burkholderiales bacterium]|nr:copper-binding protein [Burkholderiales bacterium]